MSLKSLLGVAGVAVATWLPFLTAANAQDANEGAYTSLQADRGRRIYGAFCATCHGVELVPASGR